MRRLRLIGFGSNGVTVLKEEGATSRFEAQNYILENVFLGEEGLNKVTRHQALAAINKIPTRDQQGPYDSFAKLKAVLVAIASEKATEMMGIEVDRIFELREAAMAK